MGFEINIPIMKKKTEIEDKLLYDINNNFQEFINDIDWIKNNSTQCDAICEDLKNHKYSTQANLTHTNLIQTQLFEYPSKIYTLFQCFYSQRKNYMGMNLTGLVQGKMETGLGFRNNVVKMSLQSMKDNELKNIITNVFSNTDILNIGVYKINTNGFEWEKYNVDKFIYVYVIVDLELKKYFFVYEK